jgi:peptide deformylase
MHIYRYEKNEEREVLQTKSLDVPPTQSDLDKMIEEMFSLIHRHRGIGLAAPQVGINLRFFIIEIDKGSPYVFINPEIIATSQVQVCSEEGCLSLPGLYSDVTRYASITVQAEDRNRKRFKLEASGLLAICIQHEYDHLNGIMHIDHIKDESMKQEVVQKYIRKRRYKLIKGR